MQVLILFFCSGATALVYEVVWSKYLSQLFGSTVQAQTVVLAVFMGGLALGNRWFGHRADRSPAPLALYGYLELAIGIYAFFFGALYALADTLFVALGSKLVEQSGLLLLLKGIISVGLLFPPTVMMGGTLPILAAWLQRSKTDAGRSSARFYSVNSLGAVTGSALAGFYLVTAFGLKGTLQITAFANLLIGVVAILLSRQGGLERPTPVEPAKSVVQTEATKSPVSLPLAGGIVMLTGAVSMGLEVLAARSLVMIFGASLQAFATVLMAFILGIGLGAAVIASPRFKQWRHERTTGILLLAAAAWVILLLGSIEEWVVLYAKLRGGLAHTDMGYVFHQLLIAGISLVVLGIPAAMLGAVLPLWMRAVAGATDSLGTQVGRLLTFNTCGAVGGVLLTGFVLMPWLGLRGAFALWAIVLVSAAVWLAARARERTVLLAGGVVAGAVLLVTFIGGESWRHVISSGVFRLRDVKDIRQVLELRKANINLPFYEDGADATVAVQEIYRGTSSNQLTLTINGKPDASSNGDLCTQYLLAHLPLLAKPEAQDVFVLGFGSGITAGAATSHPIKHLTVAENCGPVLEAGKLFNRWNRGVLTNPIVRVREEDARTLLKLEPRSYDVIICQPSNPWTVGIGSVFSQEFYELAAQRLKPGGIMTQWFHLYEMHDGIVSLVLNTFRSVFPYVEIWDTGSGDILMLGSTTNWKSNPDHWRTGFQREQPALDMQRIGISSPEALYARQLASQWTAFAIPEDVGVQSDEYPILEYAAPHAFYLGEPSRMLFNYDERTRQLALAPPRKRADLAALSATNLARIFGTYSTINSELKKYLALRMLEAENPAALRVQEQHRPVSCVFLPPFALSTNEISALRDVTEEQRGLLLAETHLHLHPTNWQASVQTILTALEKAQPTHDQVKEPLQPAGFAPLATRTVMVNGNLSLALEILRLAQQVDPASPELHYLGRIRDRAEEIHKQSGATPASTPKP